VPLEKASKKWHICVLFPHLKDTSWVAAVYGVTDEAKRLGVKMTVFEAGGYTNLSRQISQYDDCVALGADAIIVGAISEAGLLQKLKEGADKGLVQVGLINPMVEAPVTSAIFNDYDSKAEVAGKAVVELFKDKEGPVNAVDFPGPAGSGWAELSAQGFERAAEGTNIEILEHKYGETGKAEQLKLVEDAFQTYDDIDIIFGTGVTAEAAPNFLRDIGAEDVVVVSWFATDGVWKMLKERLMYGTASEPLVITSRIGVDLAVRALEGETVPKRLRPHSYFVSQDTLDQVNWDREVAPEGWEMTFTVE
jgi:protein TorT